ncbi:hypothetical protein CONCODRAFT_165605 [Conidiobolus coronatus NRRL 28638]|uniref:Dymeclin n=1 Tax=Conidiobolus coronatus (strain ATCC 28846 / CBS 209.66 / NRRL 28638) TaxID=796925 RepID=A0A137P3F9_CONC2|nr:hypothetical protein CONCODRAFT_165605 [Conidiobolus coronatus NRRL 28638]|eukprot:KXN69552.1 hypothetical protein CONCODRAFT_165605 [Conidiobolus coronatus NRRL 28638]
MTNPLRFPKGSTDPLMDITREDKLPDSFVNKRKTNQPIAGAYSHPTSLYEIQAILSKITELSDITSLENIFSADAFCLTLNREEEDIIIRTINKYSPELIFDHNCNKINRIVKFIISSCPVRSSIKVKPQISNSVSNALFFTQKLIKLMLNSLYFNQLVAQIDGPAKEINIPKEFNFLDSKKDKPQYFVFIDWLIEVVISLELESIVSINFYHQALVTLLTLASHDSYSLDDAYVLNYILINHGHNANIIINRCLSLYFVPKTLEGYSLTGMFSYAYSCLFDGIGVAAKQQNRLDFRLKSAHYPNTLSYLAVHLISLLCFTNTIDNKNPFIKVFEDYFEPISGGGSGVEGTDFFRLDISQVYYILTPNLHIEETSVLFYLFSIKNTEFLNYCCSVAEPDKLIIPIIKLIYESAIQNNKLAHCHILLPTLLAFCNDSLYIESLQKTMVHKQAWFQERLFRSIPLCELIMLVVIKVFNINLVGIKNQFIHSLSLSCIASLGKQLHNIHPLLVQKIISLVDIGYKNLLKYGQPNRDRGDKLEGIKIFEEIIYIVLITINTIVAKGLPSSSQFVYGLLLRNDKLLQLQSHPLISPIVENLLAVVSYYQSKLSEIDSQLMTADELMVKVQQISKACNPQNNKPLPTLSIQYIQIDSNYDFWKMYVWILIELRAPVLLTDQLIKDDIQSWWS